jgi:hypothetical protein
MSRRKLLTAGAAVSTAGLLGGLSPVRAFSIEEPSADLDHSYQAARAAACAAPDAYHRKLLLDIRALLSGQKLAQSEKRRIETEASCPLCGCPLAGDG